MRCALGCGREASEQRAGWGLCWWCGEIVARWTRLIHRDLSGMEFNAAAGTMRPRGA